MKPKDTHLTVTFGEKHVQFILMLVLFNILKNTFIISHIHVSCYSGSLYLHYMHLFSNSHTNGIHKIYITSIVIHIFMIV
jgi:hypothetical protein